MKFKTVAYKDLLFCIKTVLKVLTMSSNYRNIEAYTTTTIMSDKIVVNQPAIEWFMHFLKSSTSITSLLNHLKLGTSVGVGDGCY